MIADFIYYLFFLDLGKEFDSNLKEFIDLATFQNINPEKKGLTDKLLPN
jgi:hypothetical protein